MGDGGAIADATATLKDLLEDTVGETYEVTLSSPDYLTDDSETTVGFFLYGVTESEHTSSVERRDVDPTTVRRGPLAVDCKYLLTAYPGGDWSDSDQAVWQHRALGNAMRVLRDNPVIRGSALRGSLEGELRIVQTETEPEVMDVWGTFDETPYFPSVAYRVGPVTIESEAEEAPGRVETLEHDGYEVDADVDAEVDDGE